MATTGEHSTYAWDRPTRAFHWINLVLVCLLVASGLFFQYREAFSVSSSEAKMALKTAHAWIGYVFAVNLGIRCVWGFLGNANARWRTVLPTWQTFGAVGGELRALAMRQPVSHLVRSPVSRISATLMFVVMVAMAATGLVRAGTDLYYLPFGPAVAAFVAKPDTEPSAITWRSERELGDPTRLGQMNQVKLLAGAPHSYGSWVLIGLIALHIAGVTLTEIRQRSGLISTMVSGRSQVNGTPRADSDRTPST